MPKLTMFPHVNVFSQVLIQSYLFSHQTGSSLKGALFVAWLTQWIPCDWQTSGYICYLPAFGICVIFV